MACNTTRPTAAIRWRRTPSRRPTRTANCSRARSSEPGGAGVSGKVGADFVLVAGGDGDLAEGGAFDLVVLVEAHLHGGGGVVGLPAPLADGDELQRHAMIGMQAGALAADVELVA